MVEEVFIREALILHLHVRGQVIATTAEHPVYRYGTGWCSAGELIAGDWLLTATGRWEMVEEVFATGELQTVYNVAVAEFHTYFVGDEGWGFAVWAHNASYPRGSKHGNSHQNPKPATLYGLYTLAGRFLKWGISSKPDKRYPKDFMKDKRLVPQAEGPRARMAAFERELERQIPGPENKTPWAGRFPRS